MIAVTHLYDDAEHARAAVKRLRAAGIAESEISIIANNADNRYDDGDIIDRDRDGTDDRTEGAQTGAGVGASVGGIAGLLAGLGIMAIPGIGPVVAAGWLASTAVGAAVGGVGGGIIGALTQAGVSEEAANVYAEGVRRGGTLVTVRVDGQNRSRVEQLLSENSVDVASRRNDYETSGWKRFDERSKHMTAEELKRERARYMEGGI